jgi:hypothetical protein
VIIQGKEQQKADVLEMQMRMLMQVKEDRVHQLLVGDIKRIRWKV